jgi:hypothetical protein
MSEPLSGSVCRYLVAECGGLWRVSHDDAHKGAFVKRGEAVDFACALARDIALCGAVSAVVVAAEVYELHCFTPDHAPDLAATRPDLAEPAQPRRMAR